MGEQLNAISSGLLGAIKIFVGPLDKGISRRQITGMGGTKAGR